MTSGYVDLWTWKTVGAPFGNIEIQKTPERLCWYHFFECVHKDPT